MTAWEQRALEVLRGLEQVDWHISFGECAWCIGKMGAHEERCELAALLRDAPTEDPMALLMDMYLTPPIETPPEWKKLESLLPPPILGHEFKSCTCHSTCDGCAYWIGDHGCPSKREAH